MGILYVVKEFGRCHYFKTADERAAFISTLSAWEQKCALSYEIRFGKVA